MQTYKNIETVVYDDLEGVGSGESFNRAISYAKGDIIVLLCADDYFTDKHVIEDIVKCFETHTGMGHVSRWYYQFVDGDKRPVRAWRGDNIFEIANNPSGLAFRKSILDGKFTTLPGKINYVGKLVLTNKMFIEAPFLVQSVIERGWLYSILKYDTVAVRVHKSTARSKDYYKKMWTSSPVLEWAKLGWESNDFTSLIQISNYFTRKAVWDEICNFVWVNPDNIFNPCLWFFGLVALIIPTPILLKIPDIYRATWGKWTTREVKRK